MSALAEPIGCPSSVVGPGAVEQLRFLALRSLSRMFRPCEGLFAFRIRRTEHGDDLEGVSRRYTAIALIGLAEEAPGTCDDLLAVSAESLCQRLLEDIGSERNLGDVALVLWAARALRHTGAERALERLRELNPLETSQPTIEFAWALTALCLDGRMHLDERLAVGLARRLVAAQSAQSGLFPHQVDAAGFHGLRGHVGSFADQVYPIQALAHYATGSHDMIALESAARCARRICELQGLAGQWWWHYDVRTGRVVEGYPVYSVHQDAMAPMSLFALQLAGGPDLSPSVYRGMAWLFNPPESDEPLIDLAADLIWRKVARHEPARLSRTVQALACRMHPSLHVPGLDRLLRPGWVDRECRPYHLGWFLHAWSPERLAKLRTGREQAA